MIAWVGIGANLGDARANVLDAIDRLARLPGARLVQTSSLYRTAPIDSSGDDYVNAVAALATDLDAHALLRALFAIEQAHGRERPYRNAPRTLDLDLLLYGDAVIDDAPALIVPHPRMHERAFVLAPLAEVAPGLVIPGRGAVSALLAAAGDQGVGKLTWP
ncbi:2-amino-4-hydroxy-6-hydroxymethyldihydropteridine diphosphokinase [Massilia sp. Root335]|uniref:2-amino-4-hydroxy-6- hydroxymethyldihydropteridine diphosphokinase n=1 Tax=Massilia sp. Root335 TaxID=1736517 RepID=UPI0006FBBD14|nr:2-amino-4-hydroxy-6-hydroxymethyldihydropteridine diphosphokinase [Massilia sp. Root335]KQV39122.1 2-amino-4-hydroxy-6-hydroxymethyldihydropteridine pyrophosphokinase [Massilia sp. Root335]